MAELSCSRARLLPGQCLHIPENACVQRRLYSNREYVNSSKSAPQGCGWPLQHQSMKVRVAWVSDNFSRRNLAFLLSFVE